MGRVRSDLRAAVGATLTLLLAMFLGRFTLGTPLIPELIAQQLFAIVPLGLFTTFIRLLGFGAKWVAFALAIAGYAAGGIALGWGYRRWMGRSGGSPSLASGCLFGMAVWVMMMALGMPLLGTGFFGGRWRAGLLVSAAGLFGLHLLYGALLGWLARPTATADGVQRPQPAVSSGLGRRLFLGGLLGLCARWLAVAGGESLGLTVVPRIARAAGVVFTALKGLAAEVTPTAKFYTISISLFDPTPNRHTWRLKVHGLVDHPLTLSLEAIRAMPAYEAHITFLCISNEIGGNLMGNALWKGVPLKDLLALAQVKAGARKVILRADDGYSTGVPLERCLRPHTFLAYEMNGEELPANHGFPLRAVIPGYYGMKQPKWLTEIEVVDYDYLGYWEERDWADEAVVKTMSRIDVPRHRSQISPSGAVVAGVAFAGERGISTVEYSSDGGQTWQTAQVKPPLSPFSWVLWAGPLEMPQEGDYLLAVRATDGQGHTQDARVTEPLPDGVSGYHKIQLKVKNA